MLDQVLGGGRKLKIPETSFSAEQLTSMGYRRISRAFQHVSRIDFSDWELRMAKLHTPWSTEKGLKWVVSLKKQKGSAEDHYRRCYSSDRVFVPNTREFFKIPPSAWDPVGYIPLEEI